jgi:hypothetical protein
LRRDGGRNGEHWEAAKINIIIIKIFLIF